jgi:hypothetical protein
MYNKEYVMKRFSEYNKIKTTVSDMVYKSPVFEDQLFMHRGVSLFEMKTPLKIDSCYANDSEETYSEILEIADYVELSSEEDQDFARKHYPEDFTECFIDYCIEHNLPVNESKIRKMVEEMKIIGSRLKYRFNRPRPTQLAKKLDIHFSQNEQFLSDSPSYPSNHSLQSRMLSLYLSNIFPSHSHNFLNMAEKIGISRLHLGIHYSSDHDAGISVANQLYERLKDKT